jgi:hypothetical protein
MKIRVHARRFIEETKTFEVEVPAKDGRRLLDDKAFAHVWAEEVAAFDKLPWRKVKKAPRIETHIERVTDS